MQPFLYDVSDPYFRLKPEAILDEIQRQQLKRWWVAEFTGVHRTTLRRWLKGDIRLVSAAHLGKLAEVLQAPPHALAEPLTPGFSERL